MATLYSDFLLPQIVLLNITPVSGAEVITASSAESLTPEETSEPGFVLGNKFLKDRTGER